MPVFTSVRVSGTIPVGAPGGSLAATCPTGQRPVSASFWVGAGSFYWYFTVTSFYPTSSGWVLGVRNSGSFVPASTSLTVYCATMAP